MKGQSIHNAEAASQHPHIASWCESSALKLAKMRARMFDRERVEEGELRLWHLQSTSRESPPPPPTHLPASFNKHERSHVRFTVSEVAGQPTPVSTARINNC